MSNIKKIGFIATGSLLVVGVYRLIRKKKNGSVLYENKISDKLISMYNNNHKNGKILYDSDDEIVAIDSSKRKYYKLNI